MIASLTPRRPSGADTSRGQSCCGAFWTSTRSHVPGAPKKSRTGSVTFTQRFGSTINAHTHFHANIIDGVFAPGEDGEAVFFQATDLTQADVEDLCDKVRKRTLAHPMRIISFITDPPQIERILDHMGIPSSPPTVSPARGQSEFDLELGPDPPADSWS